jgi:hypothetical protein
MVHVWPDPQASALPHAPDITTIRIISQFDFSDWDATLDSRQRSVLTGFASVGGVWTLLDGLFMLLFGSYLMRILFGVSYSDLQRVRQLILCSTMPGKQLISVIGFVHFFQKTALRDNCTQESGFPNLQTDLEGIKGFNAFMAEYVVDVDFLRRNPLDDVDDGQPNVGGEQPNVGDEQPNVGDDNNQNVDDEQPNVDDGQPERELPRGRNRAHTL